MFPDPLPAPPLGLFRLGPFELTPRLRLGTLGVDTNVFYTPVDRTTDLSASARPGLEIALPIRRSFRLIGEGWVDVVYFAKTTSQRQVNGGGRGRAEWNSPGLLAGVERSYTKRFFRPSYELNDRVSEGVWRTAVDLELRGRLGVRTAARLNRYEPEAGQVYSGADVRRNLARDEDRLELGLGYRITQKTSLFVEGDHQRDRFLENEARDADSNRVYGGLEVVSPTRVSGRLEAGARSFRPLSSLYSSIWVAYGKADLTYRFGPRTAVTVGYLRDLNYTVFDSVGRTPTYVTESYSLSIDKGLGGGFNVVASGGYSETQTDGPVVIETSDGTVTEERRDRSWSGGLNIGYTFRSRLRLGVGAVYNDRYSNYSDFGVDGLLLGASLTLNPN